MPSLVCYHLNTTHGLISPTFASSCILRKLPFHNLTHPNKAPNKAPRNSTPINVIFWLHPHPDGSVRVTSHSMFLRPSHTSTKPKGKATTKPTKSNLDCRLGRSILPRGSDNSPAKPAGVGRSGFCIRRPLVARRRLFRRRSSRRPARCSGLPPRSPPLLRPRLTACHPDPDIV